MSATFPEGMTFAEITDALKAVCEEMVTAQKEKDKKIREGGILFGGKAVECFPGYVVASTSFDIKLKNPEVPDTFITVSYRNGNVDVQSSKKVTEAEKMLAVLKPAEAKKK